MDWSFCESEPGVEARTVCIDNGGGHKGGASQPLQALEEIDEVDGVFGGQHARHGSVCPWGAEAGGDCGEQ